jgi:hypothetical protein
VFSFSSGKDNEDSLARKGLCPLTMRVLGCVDEDPDCIVLFLHYV